MNHFYLLIICCLSFAKCFACTDFILIDQKKQCVVGRSMEFGTDLNSEIMIAPSGEQETSVINGKNGMSWEQRYAFMGLNALGVDRLIVDGMNEKGLSFGVLWLPTTKYPEISMNDLSQTIALQDAGMWILGSFATVDEVKQALSKVQIYPNILSALGKVPPLHMSIHDRKGNSIVVEFINGEMQISANPVGVLTNDPKLEWHLTNLENYINLTALNKGSVDLDGTVLNPTGQGSGLLGIPGDWTPPSRFVKIALMKQFVQKVSDAKLNANLAFHLLNTVDIPYGAIQEESGKNFDYTQWIVVKDLANGILYYRTYKDLNISSVNLTDALEKGAHKIPME